MKKLNFVLLAAVLGLSAGHASAADYTYVGVAYTDVNLEDSTAARGYSVEGSLSLGDIFFVEGGYSNGDDSDLPQGTASVGLGARGAISDDSDIYGVATSGVVVNDVQDLDKYTLDLEVGIRTQLLDSLELSGGVLTTNVTRSATFYGIAGAEYAVTDNIHVGADVFGRENVFGGQVGVRLYF